MSNLPIEVVDMLGQTLAKVLPVTLALALLFSVLSHFWAGARVSNAIKK